MKIKIISATNEKSAEGLSIVNAYNKISGTDEIKIFTDNTRGLSEVYNEAIEIYKDDCDVLLFCHDDLFISDVLFSEKLENAMKTFDVVGIAGTNNISLSKPSFPEMPTAWHNSDRKGWAGFVEHPHGDGLYSTTYFGPTPAEVVTIDGLFIAVKTSSITDKIRFDEQFMFDFYDLDFCFTCYTNELKIGVEGIYCRHNSHGEGLLKPEYKETEKLFLNKWKKEN